MPIVSEEKIKKNADKIKVAISGELAKQGLQQKDIKKRLEPYMSESTYKKRMRDPRDITIGELYRISNVLNTTAENLFHGIVSGMG